MQRDPRRIAGLRAALQMRVEPEVRSDDMKVNSTVRLVSWPLYSWYEYGRAVGLAVPCVGLVAIPTLPKVEHWAVQIGSVFVEITGADKDKRNNWTSIRMSKTAMRDEPLPNGKFKSASLSDKIVGYTRVGFGSIVWFCSTYIQKHPKYMFHSENCQKFAIELIKFATQNRHCKLPPVCGASYYVYATKPHSRLREGEGKISTGGCQVRCAFLGAQADGPEASFTTKNGVIVDARAGSAGVQVLNAKLEIGFQLRTGMQARNGSFELIFFGFGVKLGRNFGLSTPMTWIDTE
mmetsp:Transcript_31229/g.76180  ORF Transcript_31229/g.76180 Transcript_31229/m.76180 type:complete len:292 (+) Transcript_31229:111-986(+)